MGLALARSKWSHERLARREHAVRAFRLATDVVVFTIRDDDLKVLLVRRAHAPFRGCWTLPGGFVGPRESSEEAARRLLREQTHVANLYLEQLYTFAEPDRDPRGRVVSVAYFALGQSSEFDPGLSNSLRWFSLYDRPALGFDHGLIVDYALERLRNKLEYTTVGFELLPRRFTLSELQQVYEIILHKQLDKRNFRKKIFSLGILRAQNATRRKNGGRPARLYSFAANQFIRLKDRGILFPF